MNILLNLPPYPVPPDHKGLPDTDGSIVQNFQELPQSMLLTGAIRPLALSRFGEDGFVIGQDSGIYWRWTDPPLNGCKAPDWYLVIGRPPMLDGECRRSYVLWVEGVAPAVVIEYVSGDGSEERDRTPGAGKFWVYEQGIRAPFYAIYEVRHARVEVHHLVDGRYQLLPANERGHYPIPPLGTELGIWQGRYYGLELPWLRWWDASGQLLPASEELADEEAERADEEKRRAGEQKERADKEQERADKEQERAARLAAKLRALGVDPDQLGA